MNDSVAVGRLNECIAVVVMHFMLYVQQFFLSIVFLWLCKSSKQIVYSMVNGGEFFSHTRFVSLLLDGLFIQRINQREIRDASTVDHTIDGDPIKHWSE